MAYYPCTEIVTEENIAVTVYGPHFHVFDTLSGKLLQTTTHELSTTASKLSASVAIRNVAMNLTGRYLATVDEQKNLKVWELDTLKLLSTRELPKKPNQVIITKDGQTIVVADKFGDVFSYPVVAPDVPRSVPPPPPPNTHEGRKSLVSHANPSSGTLILGHTSSLLAMTLTSDERFILTADRDEHIRVSNFPQGYRIERFCLGHTKYVSALHLPSHRPTTLISGGGDHYLYIWDYITGELKGRLEVWSHIRPMMVAQSQRRKFQRMEVKAGSGWRARKRKEKEAKEAREKEEHNARFKSKIAAKGSAPSRLDTNDPDREAALATNEKADEPMSPIGTEVRTRGTSTMDDVLQDTAESASNVGRANLPALEDIMVISKIDTLKFASTYAVIFTAIGARALFFARYNYDDTWALDQEVYQHTFSKPVLDFSVSSSEHGTNRIWVTIDHSFSFSFSDITPTTPPTGIVSGTVSVQGTAETSAIAAAAADFPNQPAEISGPGYVNSSTLLLLEWSGGDKLEEVISTSVPLLCTLHNLDPIPATPKDLEMLDLYGLLTALPKTEELEDSEVAGAIIMEDIEITGTQGATRTKLELKEAGAEEGLESRALRDSTEPGNSTNGETKNAIITAKMTSVATVTSAKARTTMTTMSTSSAPTTSTISSSRENLGGTRRDDSGRSAQSQQTGEAVSESNKREVKKQGRKKWQMKMESRQQQQKSELIGSGTLLSRNAADSTDATPTTNVTDIDTDPIANATEATDVEHAIEATGDASHTANKRDKKNAEKVASSSWGREDTSSVTEEMDIDEALDMETETGMSIGKGKGIAEVLEMEKGGPMEMDIEGETGVSKEEMSSEVGKKSSRTARTGDDDVDPAHSSDERAEHVTKKARTSAR